MPLAKMNKVKKYYGDRLILDIDKFEIEDGDKIGIVGRNGVGKTTFIKTLIGEIPSEEGQVKITDSYSYITQNEEDIGECNNNKVKSLFCAPDKYENFLSGGEKVKIRISQALGENVSLIIADEPTANLDQKSIKKLEELLQEFKGALLIVSHDRKFLDGLCNRIIELEDGVIHEYHGNYETYIELKGLEKTRQEKEHQEYIREKSRLENIIVTKKELRDKIKKAPKGMGKSEAKTIKMGDQAGKKTLDNNIKSIKNKIEHLEVKEKPKKESNVIIKIQHGKELNAKTIIRVKDLDIKVKDNILINKGSFSITNGKKVAIIGENGCGKTTLLKEILLDDNSQIEKSNNMVIGYFDQGQSILNENKSILENIKEDSSYDESFIRINLSEFGFKGDDVYKIVGDLSGGERVKVAICKVILLDNNVLILDEPTNYLDIKSMEALEIALKNTEKTVLLVSHDRKFIENICDYIIEIKDNKINEFNGKYLEFLESKDSVKISKSEKRQKDELLVLENRLSDIIFSISVENDEVKKCELDKEYNKLLKQVKNLKEEIKVE